MVNYPNKQSNYNKKKISKSNRGMSFETIINETNEYYINNEKAIIHKKPIPIQIVNVSYPSRSAAVIKEAYYKTPSTTDYNGVYKGYYIDFEAKETHKETSFPLSNIHSHQIDHLRQVNFHGAVSFILVSFTKLDRFFLLETPVLINFVNRSLTGRKSITLEEFVQYGYEIKEGYAPRLDYIKIVDQIIEKRLNHKN
jgi:recombination protein U